MGVDGKRLRALRESRGITPRQMADKLNISRPSYLNYENGKTTMPRKLEQIADFFGVSTEYLLGRDVPRKLGERISVLREINNIPQEAIAKKLNIEVATVSQIERGQKPISEHQLEIIADVLNEPKDKLIANLPQVSLPKLTKRDERKIASDLEDMIHSLDGAAAMGNSDDAEDMELLKSALEQAMRLSKRIAKRKFAPKRNKKEG